MVVTCGWSPDVDYAIWYFWTGAVLCVCLLLGSWFAGYPDPFSHQVDQSTPAKRTIAAVFLLLLVLMAWPLVVACAGYFSARPEKPK